MDVTVKTYSVMYAPWEEGADERQRIDTDESVETIEPDEDETPAIAVAHALRNAGAWHPSSSPDVDARTWWTAEGYEHPHTGELLEMSFHLSGADWTDALAREVAPMVTASPAEWTQYESNAGIARLVSDAVAAGLLTERPAMNPPGADYESRDIYAGRTASGDRVFISARFERLERPAMTVTHEPVGERWAIALSGFTVPKGRRVTDETGSFGQVSAQFRRVIGVKGIRAVADIWDAWHLNDMRAGCAHVPEPVMRAGRYGPEVDLDLTPACPVSSYRYGHAWLYAPLPVDAVATVLTFLSARKAGN